jgi:hypothetical protein
MMLGGINCDDCVLHYGSEDAFCVEFLGGIAKQVRKELRQIRQSVPLSARMKQLHSHRAVLFGN